MIFLEINDLVLIFALGFISGSVIGFGSWTIHKIVQVFKKFF